MYILPLDQITVQDASRVGGKALSLGELVRAGLNVPPGIVVTTDAYRAFVELNGLKREHDDLLAHPELNDPKFKARITNFRARLVTLPLPDDIARALGDALRDWVPVHTMAVRSSALAEDLPDNSFAGQYDTFLNQRGLPQILDAVKKCWASLWNERALVYRASSGLARDNVAMGVIIQLQVAATASGVMFTLDPLSGHETEMVIEATWGLGEALVSGHVTPDHFVVDWLEGKIITKQIADKGMMVAFAADENEQARGEEGRGYESETPAEKRFEPSLTDVQTLALASLGERIMAHYGAPQDIEWSFGHIADSTG
ncbi:MAG TPA: PEP/pyruvate-binding domain-containing protein [Anaerolineae bacterium]